MASSAGAVFVSVTADGTAGSETGVQIFGPAAGGGLQSICLNGLPSSLLPEGPLFANLGLMPGGMDVAGGIGAPGAIFYDVAALQCCAATGFVASQGGVAADEGTLEVAVTADQSFAFVSNEYGVASGAATTGNIGVVQLQLDAAGDVATGTTLIRQIATGGNTIAGMTLSPDGTRLYVTSEVAAANAAAAGGGNPLLSRSGCVQQTGGESSINGLLTVIDVGAAETATGAAVAGGRRCRLLIGADGGAGRRVGALGRRAWRQPRAGLQSGIAGVRSRPGALGICPQWRHGSGGDPTPS